MATSGKCCGQGTFCIFLVGSTSNGLLLQVSQLQTPRQRIALAIEQGTALALETEYHLAKEFRAAESPSFPRLRFHSNHTNSVLSSVLALFLGPGSCSPACHQTTSARASTKIAATSDLSRRGPARIGGFDIQYHGSVADRGGKSGISNRELGSRHGELGGAGWMLLPYTFSTRCS